jgi:hypothetical protein
MSQIDVEHLQAGADWLPWDFFQGAPKKKKKIAARTKLLA